MADENDLMLPNKVEHTVTAEQRMKSAVLRVIDNCLSDILALVGKYDNASEGGCRLTELMEEVVVVVKRKLLFSPRLEYLYASQLKAVETRASNGNAISILENKFKEAQEFRISTLKAQDDIIRTIEEQIRNLEVESHDHVVEIRSQTLNELDHMEKRSCMLQNKLQEELLQREELYHELEKSNLQRELELREKRKIIEAEILETIQEYDTTMEELVGQKNKIKNQESKITEILCRRQEEFKILETKYNKVQEQKAKEEERKMAAIQEEFHREHSARIIQKAWSHYKMRKMLKNAKRKGRRKKMPSVKESSKKK